MEQEIFLRRQSRIMEAFSSRRFREAAYLCNALRKELEEESTSASQPDSTQLGWIKSCHFQAACKSGDLLGAYELYHSEDPFPVSLSHESKRAMEKEMPRICSSLEKTSELLRFGRKELAHFQGNEPAHSATKIARQQCDYFRHLDRDELNLEFALILLQQNHKQNTAPLDGFSFLLRNFEKTMNESIADMLLNHLPLYLESAAENKKMDEAQINFDRLETILTSNLYIRRSEDNQNQLLKAKEAIYEDKPAKLRASILDGSPLNILDQGNRISLLSIAIENGHENCVPLLLDYCSDIHGSCGQWKSPLHIASALGRTKTCSLLLDRGVALHLTDESSNDPLNYAILSKNLKLVRILLDAGAKPDSPVKPSNMPRILLALASDSNDILRQLIHSGATPYDHSQKGLSFVVEAVRNNAPLCLKELLKWNPALSEIHSAIEKAKLLRHEECLQILLKRIQR